MLCSVNPYKKCFLKDSPKNYFKFEQSSKKEADYVQQRLDTDRKFSGYNYDEDFKTEKTNTSKSTWENLIVKESANINKRKDETIDEVINKNEVGDKNKL